MPRVEIRPFEDADVPAAVRLFVARSPHEVLTEAGLRHELRASPARERRRDWVALERGELVAWVTAGFNWASAREDKGWIYLVMAPSQWETAAPRLYERALEHVRSEGARELRCWLDDPDGRPFLEERGLVANRHTLLSAVDPRAVDLSGLAALEAEKRGEGFRLTTLAAPHDPRGVHAVYAAGEADMPGDEHERDAAFEPWQAETLEHPELSRDGSFVVLHGDRPVALAFLVVDPARRLGYNEMTATVGEFRRRRLALLVKLAVIRWSVEAGIERIVTENDFDNPGMLALNRALGYEVVHTRYQFFREL
jgi:GNAT superfamily N-acetyltransferase